MVPTVEPRASGVRWQQLNELFHAALALDPADRETYLARACGEDAALLRDVEGLLRAHAGAERGLAAAERVADALREPAGTPGMRLGPYRTTAEIGRGGMGSVWLAERVDGQFAQRVAIKVIKRGMDSAQVLQRFRAERQILASLEHPNIARLMDGGTTDDGRPYFVMEYVEGRPIDRYADEEHLSVRARIELLLPVCDAIAHAHQRLIVHRDIKPQNVLVTADGVPKLLDFGIAKLLHDAEAQEGSTVAGMHALTPEYASPEQIEGAPTTTQSDVYSLGVVLYELLTGRSPYRTATGDLRALCASVLSGPIERPSTAIALPTVDATVRANRVAATGAESLDRLRQQLRGDLDAVVLSAVHRDPSRRYASVRELAGDLRRFLAGLPVSARPDGVRYRLGKFVLRNRTAVATAAVALLSLVGGAIATAWQAHEARLQAQLAQEARARAERRFGEVRKLANALIFDYHDAIRELPGATGVRVRLVGDALAYLDGLAQEAREDAALQRELALAYRRVAQVQSGSATSASLGDTGGAIASHRKSLAILEALLAADSASPQARRDVADGTIELAFLLSLTPEQGKALELAQRARDLYGSLPARSGRTLDERLALAAAHGTVGAILVESGRPTEGFDSHRVQIDLLTSAPPPDLQDPRLRRALSNAWQAIANAETEGARLDAALDSRRRSLQLSLALSNEYPNSNDYRRMVGVGWYWEASTLYELGRLREALDSFQRSAAVDDEITAADPRAGRGFFVLVRIGNVLDELGEPRRALAYYERARAILVRDVALDPTDLWKRGGLVEVEAFSCAALTRLAQHDRASGACAAASKLIEETPVDPGTVIVRASAARSYAKMGDASLAAAEDARLPHERRLAYAAAARHHYRGAGRIWDDMAARGLLGDRDRPAAVAVSRAADAADRLERSLAER
jgi:eukaryotic-like serine/threonine-protein kinase